MVFRWRKQQLSVIKADLSLGLQSRLFLAFLKSIITLRDWLADPLLTRRLPCSDFFARGFYFFLGSRFPDIVGYNFRHHPRYFTTLSPINFADNRWMMMKFRYNFSEQLYLPIILRKNIH